jgi:hypothetical protein
MTNNLKTLIQSYANGDGGETLSKNYNDRLTSVFTILMNDFPHIIKSSTHSDHSTRLYKEFANAFRLKFADVKRVAKGANEINVEDLIMEVQNV